MKASQEAIDLIVSEEVSSKAVYERRYQRPEWPGGMSGITIGIGYDCGYVTKEDIARDWSKYLPAAMVSELQRVAGIHGEAAHAQLAGARSIVSVPWDSAMAVFEDRDVPKYSLLLEKAVPHVIELPDDCYGVLLSLTYNRGAGGFNNAGDRYTEMHAIKQHVDNGQWDKIPDEIRSMKRLWDPDKQGGLISRREHEAVLFEKGLRKKPAPVPATPTGTPIATDVPAQACPSAPVNVQPDKAVYTLDTEVLQRKLIFMNYHEVGDADGKFGGKTRGAITAFMNDRGKPTDGMVTAEVVNEINTALGENWSRPIAPSRANATANDIKDKIPIVNQTWWQKVWAIVLGVPTASVGTLKLVFGDKGDAVAGYVQPARDFFSSIPSELYMFAILGIAVAVFVQAKRVQDQTVESYRKGGIN